jgi:dimethylglycine dehydrogenase
MDVARFGSYASESYTIAKAREFYAKRFQIAYPNEYWPAGRAAKTSPIHGELAANNAVFGVSYGLEIPLFFARQGEPAVEIPTLGHSNAFQQVKEECVAARNAVGIVDISSFGKYLVTGPNAEAALNRVLAGRLPPVGKIRITPMLTHSGKLMGDLTTLRLAEDRFLVSGSGYLQAWHMRWFDEHLSSQGVIASNISEQNAGLALFGPQSRELLQRLTRSDVSNEAMPFMSLIESDIAFAPATVARLSVTGELGYEIHVGAPYLRSLLFEVLRLGSDLGIRHVGMYALNSLRLEKSFGIWSREFSRDYTPRMAGLQRFIDYDRAGFIGRDAALRDRDQAPARRLVTLEIDTSDADATGYEPILLDDQLVGFVTSGGYGHCVGRSLAMGYLDSDIAAQQAGLTVAVNGGPRPCKVGVSAAWDPQGTRMRQ